MASRETGFRREAQTSAAGIYTLSQLPIGTYTVTVTQPGFRPVSVQDLRLGVGDNRTLNFRLEVSTVETAITVEDVVMPLETESPVLGTVIGSRQVREIPLNGRHWASLMESGSGAGAQVNVVSKSGSNEFHGSLLEFLRNDKFDSRNPFDTSKQPFRLNQFGGNIGGPIIKNRTFFFANYEGLRQRVSQRRRHHYRPAHGDRRGPAGKLLPPHESGDRVPARFLSCYRQRGEGGLQPFGSQSIQLRSLRRIDLRFRFYDAQQLEPAGGNRHLLYGGRQPVRHPRAAHPQTWRRDPARAR